MIASVAKNFRLINPLFLKFLGVLKHRNLNTKADNAHSVLIQHSINLKCSFESCGQAVTASRFIYL